MDRPRASTADDLTADDVELVRRTLARIDPFAYEVVRRFYAHLFESAPELKALFTRNAPEVQAQMFRETLYLIVDHLDDEPWIARTLRKLGARHAEYGVTAEMYGPVRVALVTTLAEELGAEWSDDVALAWQRAFDLIRDRMLDAPRA
jgi:hemoglobin-like flavoprotein